MMRLREPLAMPSGRKLRVVIYARYSTEGQRQTSIEDQIASCRRFLADNLPPGASLDQVDIVEIKEAEISGEYRHRSGINAIRAGIEAKGVDVIVAEESSRFYRDSIFAGDLFYAAVDAGIRIICPSDWLDTADPDWKARLLACQAQHSGSNDYTRLRIQRALRGLWDRGAAVSGVKLGYRRTATSPATSNAPADGPKFDEVDGEQAPVIREIFERAARGEPLWAVAEWLTSIKFPKASNSQRSDWSPKNVADLVRRPDYRGEQLYRRKINKQQLTTGRSRAVRNDPESVLTRQMPHLRIVSDHVWYEANAAIDMRCTRSDVPKGADHPLAGKPRDSRGLLSTTFVCGICGSPMHVDGRNEGGYRCARARNYECWNRTTCLRDQAHEAIVAAVAKAVTSISGCREKLVSRLLEIQASGGDLAAEKRKLKSEEGKLFATVTKLTSVIETTDTDVEPLVQRLQERQRDLKNVQSKLAELETRTRDRKPPPSSEDILQHLDSLQASLVANDSRAAVILKQLLDGPIRAMPYQQYGSMKVVLRAEFTVLLSNSLPPEMTALTQADPAVANLIPGGARQNLIVDLFIPSTLARHAVRAQELVETGLSLAKVGEALSISKRMASSCSRLGQAMAAAGLREPFIRLEQRPEKVARWRNRHREQRDEVHRKAS